MDFTGKQDYTWASSSADVRALQYPTGSDRLAATWYAVSSFTINLRLTGGVHRVSLYLLDWDTTIRSERIDVIDADSGATLDSKTISGFSGGQYITWDLSGNVKLQVTKLAGDNGVVQALFFGNITSPTSPTSPPTPSPTVTPSPTPAPTSTPSPTPTPISTPTPTPIPSATPSPVPPSTPTPAPATPTPNGVTNAVFKKFDLSTGGFWQGVYGQKGYLLASGDSRLSSAVSFLGHFFKTEAFRANDPRILAGSTGSCFVSTNPDFKVRVDLGPTTRSLAIYMGDFNSSQDKTDVIRVTNAVTGEVFFTKTSPSLRSPFYLVMDGSGNLSVSLGTFCGLFMGP
jgi:hypothetical protein